MDGKKGGGGWGEGGLVGAKVIFATVPSRKAMNYFLWGGLAFNKDWVIGASDEPLVVSPILFLSNSCRLWAGLTVHPYTLRTRSPSACFMVMSMNEVFTLEPAA
jgi:hypothetical protein